MKSDQQERRSGSHSAAPALRRALWIGWWAIVAVVTIFVAVNVAQSRTTDSAPLADRAARALTDSGQAAEVQAVGATSDGRVFVTLVNVGMPAGAGSGGSRASRGIAEAVLTRVPSAVVVVILNADHGVVGSFGRGR